MCSMEIRAKVKVIFIIQFSKMLLLRILSVLKTITEQNFDVMKMRTSIICSGVVA